MYIPDGVDFTAEEKIEMAKRKQEISHSNTRLNMNPFDESQNKETITELAKNQTRGNVGKIGVDGKTMEPESPQIRGFTFVKSPSPCPSLIDSGPLMTWGEIEGTPFRLDGSDTPLRTTSFGGPSFRIAETSKRETLALQLAENVSEKHRAKKSKAIEAAKRNMCATPHVRNSLDRLACMSPAARRLSSVRLARESWATPSPKVTRSSLVTPKTRSIPPVIRTPKRNRAPHSQSSYSESTLTDNLLDIPSSSKRSKAADFFWTQNSLHSPKRVQIKTSEFIFVVNLTFRMMSLSSAVDGWRDRDFFVEIFRQTYLWRLRAEHSMFRIIAIVGILFRYKTFGLIRTCYHYHFCLIKCS